MRVLLDECVDPRVKLLLGAPVRKYGNGSGAELCKVGRSPWTAAGPPAGLGATRGSRADEGVRPTNFEREYLAALRFRASTVTKRNWAWPEAADQVNGSAPFRLRGGPHAHAALMAVDSAHGLAAPGTLVGAAGLHFMCVDGIGQIHFQDLVAQA